MIPRDEGQFMDEAQEMPIELNISPEKVCFIIVKAREFDAKVDPVEPDPGSNPADAGEREVLEDYSDDATATELRAAIDVLNEDEVVDLIALAWLGRGDYDKAEWTEAQLFGRRTPSTALRGLFDRHADARRLPGRGTLEARLFLRELRNRPSLSSLRTVGGLRAVDGSSSQAPIRSGGNTSSSNEPDGEIIWSSRPKSPFAAWRRPKRSRHRCATASANSTASMGGS
jgi:hypothetical protein